MESLHPLVRAILNGLLTSPLEALGREALARLSRDLPWSRDGDYAEDNDADDIGRSGIQTGAPGIDPADPALGLSQLAVLEAVIAGHFRRETMIAARLPALAERLSLKAVFIEGPEPRTASGGGGLLARDREAAITAFVDVFKETIERARRALERELQGRRT